MFISQEYSDVNSTQPFNLSGNGTMESCDYDIKQKYISICSGSRLQREQGLVPIDPIIYRGTVCWKELNLLKDCLMDNSGESGHPRVVTDDNLEIARLALSAVDQYASPKCVAEVKPFLCLYFFGLVSEMSIEVSFQPSASHCKNLRDNACNDIWNLAQFFKLELPDCDEEFPVNNVPCSEERSK